MIHAMMKDAQGVVTMYEISEEDMQAHRQTPEQALLNKHYAEVNRLAWALRKVTGHGQLRLALLMSVPEALRPEVEIKVLDIQAKHKKG